MRFSSFINRIFFRADNGERMSAAFLPFERKVLGKVSVSATISISLSELLGEEVKVADRRRFPGLAVPVEAKAFLSLFEDSFSPPESSDGPEWDKAATGGTESVRSWSLLSDPSSLSSDV